MIGAAPGSKTTQRARTARRHDPRGSATSASPPRQAALNRSQFRATVAPTISGARSLTNSRRQDASSMRSWPFYTESLAWKPSHARDNQHRACRCKAKPMMGMAIDARRRTFLCSVSPEKGIKAGVSTDRLPISHAAARLRHRRMHRSPATIDAPTEARTSTLTPTHRHSSGGRPRTLPPRPCCCAAARSPQPPRRDERASS
jgi:hypothetical protein